MNTVLFRIHRVLGIIICLPLLIVAITGVMISYRSELNRVFYPSMTVAEVAGDALPIRTLIETFVARNGARELIYIEMARSADETDIFLSRDAAGGLYLTGMSRYTSAIQADIPLVQHGLYLAFYIHTTLLTHRYVVGAFGLALAAMAITGLMVWWPRGVMTLSQRVRTTFQVRPRQWPRDLHRAIGLVISALLLITALTGVSMVYSAAIQPYLDRVAGAPPRPDHMAIHGGAHINPDPLSYADAIDTAQMRFPDGRIVGVGQGSHDGSPSSLVMVRLRQDGDPLLQGATAMWVDSHNGAVMLTQDGVKDPLSWRLLYDVAWTVHTGTIFGGAGRVMMLMSGLGLVFMVVTGFVNWRSAAAKRRRARKKSKVAVSAA